MNLEEKHDIEKIASGDHYAFRCMFLEYFPKMKYFITHIIKSESIAEELSQDIFMKIWINREFLPNLRSLNAYLYKMAKNAALNYLDHKYIEDSFVLNFNPVQSENFSDELDARELELLVQLTIGKMPDQRRRVYEMNRIEHLKNDEIATLLRISKKTVENHLNLALKEIRRVITAATMLFL